MTIKDLIGQLSKYEDKEIVISIDGYEGGVTDDIHIDLVKIIPNSNAGIYSRNIYGEHEVDNKVGTEYRLLLGRYEL